MVITLRLIKCFLYSYYIEGRTNMAKKPRMMRTFARTASKSMEKKLVENAKKIKKNPYLVLPEYQDKYSEKVFGKIRKNIERVSRFFDDSKKLEKLSNKKGLEAAIAGAILIANSGKAPYLAVSKFPTGDITYAQRGKADKEKQIAVQHFDDPILRLLGIKDIALKKRLHVYSWDNGFISTGIEANPPEEFKSFVIRKLGLRFKEDVAFCGDLKPDLVKNKRFLEKSYLRINWKSGGIIFAVSEDCTKSKSNTLHNITKYLIEPNISEDFEVEVVGQVVKEKTETTMYVDKYLSGELSDLDFIKKNMSKRKQSLMDSGEKVFVLDGKSYGNDVDGFIDALKPNEYEKKGLQVLLSMVDEPVIFNNASPNKVLERFWEDYGLETLNSIIDDEEMAEKFYSLDDTPSEVLELVFNYKKRQEILSKLPKYKPLPPLARFADNVARTYRTFGEKKALSEIKNRPDDPKGKSVAFAFLLVLGKAKDKKWQYSPVEIEYGEFLKDYVEKLLKGDPKKYHKALKDLLVNSGSSEDVDSYIL